MCSDCEAYGLKKDGLPRYDWTSLHGYNDPTASNPTHLKMQIFSDESL